MSCALRNVNTALGGVELIKLVSESQCQGQRFNLRVQDPTRPHKVSNLKAKNSDSIFQDKVWPFKTKSKNSTA